MDDTFPSSYGTSGAAPPLLSVAKSSLAIIFEWVALLPLAIYLASSRFPHQLVGQTALTGSICAGLLPRLGVLSSVADFLQHGPDFFDRASSISELRRTVWHVRWGSVFPCANGAASDMLASYALRRIKTPTSHEEAQSDLNAEDGQSTQSGTLSSGPRTTSQQITPAATYPAPLPWPSKPDSFRSQTLCILDFSDPSQNSNTSHDLSRMIPCVVYEVLLVLGLLGACVIMVLFGLYGTSAAILVTIFFRLAARLIQVERPDGYLKSNEGNEEEYMLVALHENASVWYLFRGPRVVVDTILNKPMVKMVNSPLGIFLSFGLRVLELLQLLAMTYVASQKGWDGVALLSLVLASWMYEQIAHSRDRIAKLWLRRRHISVTAKTHNSIGRTPMIGAIHKLSRSKVNSWMDPILAPSSRRKVWLMALADESITEQQNILSEADREWVNSNKSWTMELVERIQEPRVASIRFSTQTTFVSPGVFWSGKISN